MPLFPRCPGGDAGEQQDDEAVAGITENKAEAEGEEYADKRRRVK